MARRERSRRVRASRARLFTRVCVHGRSRSTRASRGSPRPPALFGSVARESSVEDRSRGKDVVARAVLRCSRAPRVRCARPTRDRRGLRVRRRPATLNAHTNMRPPLESSNKNRDLANPNDSDEQQRQVGLLRMLRLDKFGGRGFIYDIGDYKWKKIRIAKGRGSRGHAPGTIFLSSGRLDPPVPKPSSRGGDDRAPISRALVGAPRGARVPPQSVSRPPAPPSSVRTRERGDGSCVRHNGA